MRKTSSENLIRCLEKLEMVGAYNIRIRMKPRVSSKRREADFSFYADQIRGTHIHGAYGSINPIYSKVRPLSIDGMSL